MTTREMIKGSYTDINDYRPLVSFQSKTESVCQQLHEVDALTQ